MKIHMAISIDGLLDMNDAKMKRMLNCVRDENGNHPTLTEFREYLTEEKAKGHLFLPAPGCDNFDPIKGCLGHDN